LKRIAVLSLCCWLLASWVFAAETPQIAQIETEVDGDGIRVAARLVDAFPREVEQRLESGLEISFEYKVRLRRRRRRIPDRTVSERYVVVTTQYSSLTRMFKLSRRVDGTVIDSDLTERAEVMRDWMTRLDHLLLFEPRDYDSPGQYYVSVKTKLQRRFELLFIPADVETPWAESERFVVDAVQP